VAEARPVEGMAKLERDAVDRRSPPSRTTDALLTTRYTATAQWLHWIAALLMLATIPIAWQMHEMARGVPMRAVYFTVHKSLGITILLLTVARLIWLSRHPAPPFPLSWPRWSARLARATHVLLYVLLLGMPITGYVHSATGGHPVSYFGLFDLPFFTQDDALSQVTLAVHLAGQWLLYALIVLHVLGAAWHVVVRRDGALDRILPPQTGVS
jgi:cytochrome b561